MKTLIEGQDFYYDPEGRMILTRSYLLARGRCCTSGCLNCPYEYKGKACAELPQELLLNTPISDEEIAEKYLQEWGKDQEHQLANKDKFL